MQLDGVKGFASRQEHNLPIQWVDPQEFFMSIPTFNLTQRRQARNDAKELELIERAQAHVSQLREGAQRHDARLMAYDRGGLREVMDYITKSLAAPVNQREWKVIIEEGKTKGHNGLSREPMYREFQNDADAHLLKLGSDYDSFRHNINDALRPENMTHLLGDRISQTDPNPRETLHNLIARHISPQDKAALDDAERAQAYRRHMARENDGVVFRGP